MDKYDDFCQKDILLQWRSSACATCGARVSRLSHGTRNKAVVCPLKMLSTKRGAQICVFCSTKCIGNINAENIHLNHKKKNDKQKRKNQKK